MDVFNAPAFGYHLARITRRFTASAPVAHIGYVREKRSRVDWAFESFNYSFVLRGSGTYRHNGQYLSVQAPCVLTQSPGMLMDYGPDDAWEELYLIYEAVDVLWLQSHGLIPPHPMWPIQDPGRLQTHLNDLLRILSLPYLDPNVDRVDALCQMLVLESLLGERDAGLEARTVRQIETYVNTHLYVDIDFAALAKEHDLHPAAFRRRWMREVGVPPARYLMAQRIKEACRLLAETDTPVGEIAGFLRFDDPLYFSRKFRSVTGLTATDYRRRYRAHISLTPAFERLA